VPSLDAASARSLLRSTLPLPRFDRLLRQLDALLTAEQLQQHQHARFATRAAIRTHAFGITDLYSVPRGRNPICRTLISFGGANKCVARHRQCREYRRKKN
jgi:hypothetical protein